jgi:nitroreductase
MTYNDFKSLCETRRSVRYFDDKPVSKEDILKLLELAHLAPSVENLQPWHFHVILNKELRHELTETCCYGNFIEGAGAFIIVTVNRSLTNAPKEPVWNERELEYSCMGAMMNILHGATAMGLGSCWVSLYHGKPHELLQLPRHETIVGGVMLGHFKKGEEKPSGEHQRHPLKDLYTFHE